MAPTRQGVSVLSISVVLGIVGYAESGPAALGPSTCQDASTSCASTFQIPLRDGSRVWAHADTLASLTLGPNQVPEPPPPPQPPVCVSDPSTEYHGVLVYAVPEAVPDRYDQLAPIIRDHFLTANGILFAEAQSLGGSAKYKMQCTGAVADVLHVVLPQVDPVEDTPGAVINDLKFEVDLDSVFAKYWVWYDDPWLCTCIGLGTIDIDDSLALGNLNNVGPDWAIVTTHPYTVAYGYQVLMHENAHNLGAIQFTAPHEADDHHCSDGPEAMCPFDAGQDGSLPYEDCNPNTFDCHKDDYFHLAPPSGTYLSDHWNLGNSLNRFIQFS